MTDVLDRFAPHHLSDREWYYPRSATTLPAEETLSAGSVTPANTYIYYGYYGSSYSLGHVSFVGIWEGATQLREAAAALHQLLQLPEGWDSYGAPRINEEAVSAAWMLLRHLLWDDIRLPRIVPTAEGGVQLEWYGNDIDLQIEVASAHDITLFYRNLETGESWEGALGKEPQPLGSLIHRAGASQ